MKNRIFAQLIPLGTFVVHEDSPIITGKLESKKEGPEKGLFLCTFFEYRKSCV